MVSPRLHDDGAGRRRLRRLSTDWSLPPHRMTSSSTSRKESDDRSPPRLASPAPGTTAAAKVAPRSSGSGGNSDSSSGVVTASGPTYSPSSRPRRIRPPRSRRRPPQRPHALPTRRRTAHGERRHPGNEHAPHRAASRLTEGVRRTTRGRPCSGPSPVGRPLRSSSTEAGSSGRTRLSSTGSFLSRTIAREATARARARACSSAMTSAGGSSETRPAYDRSWAARRRTPARSTIPHVVSPVAIWSRRCTARC